MGQRRDHGLEENFAGEALFSVAAYQHGFHGGCFADNDKQTPARLQCQPEALLFDGQRAGDKHHVVARLLLQRQAIGGLYLDAANTGLGQILPATARSE